MKKRNEFLHNVALSIRTSRRNNLKPSATLEKIRNESEVARQAFLNAQSNMVAISAEADRALKSRYITEKERKDYLRRIKTSEKEMLSLHSISQNIMINLINCELDEEIRELENLLKITLTIDDYFEVQTLKISPQIPQYTQPNLGDLPVKPDPQTYLPLQPSGLKAMLPGVQDKYRQDYKAAVERYKQDFEIYRQHILSLKTKVENAKDTYKRQVAHIRANANLHNTEIDEFGKQLEQGHPEALIDYFAFVLEASLYPDNFSQHAKLAFVPESKQLVVEYDLPPFNIVPEIGSYKFVKAKGDLVGSPRAASQRKSLYSSVIAQITIRTIHELFESDRLGHLETIIFNGYVDAIDRGTGRKLRECIVTVRVAREVFLGFDLSQVDPIACLKVLHASVSKVPEELAPVKPVLEFSMVDPRFIEETDVLSSLDTRPNLMELKPTEFEALIANLFEKMGLETRQTQASRDGGVDCVAYDTRPILGGKVVIQAKRYKHTVGVSAVRDLFGTLQNEGASKGILVTTSGFGQASTEFAAGKPIELISGSNLLYLLETHAGVKAKIVPPETWKDPHPDSASGEIG